MIKKLAIIFLFTFSLNENALSAATTPSGAEDAKSFYKQAVKYIIAGKTFEKKGKIKTAQKRYKRALKFLVKANNDKKNNADTLNYLGFVTRKLGDFEKGEKYYLEGLAIDPNHKGINEYLGELYVATNRLELAKERLKVLENCKCEEYIELKEIIEGTKTSKY